MKATEYNEIIITEDVDAIAVDAWDYPLEEIPYLLETRGGEKFVYCNGRLFETEGSAE